jgi:hypothetical protein
LLGRSANGTIPALEVKQRQSYYWLTEVIRCPKARVVRKYKGENDVKRVIPALALTVLVAVSVWAARPQDETPGSQSTITAAVPAGGYSCGRASYPEYCFGVPTNFGGTFWLDCYYKGEQNQNVFGFIVFNNVVDLGQATITQASVVMGPAGPTSLTVTFHGTTNDGDNGNYTGTGTFTFAYYKGGYGRSYGWYQTMTRGSMTITYI